MYFLGPTLPELSTAFSKDFVLLSGHRTRASGMLVGIRFREQTQTPPINCDTHVAVYRKGINKQFDEIYQRIGSYIKIDQRIINTHVHRTQHISSQSIYVREDDFIALYVPDNADASCVTHHFQQSSDGPGEEILVYIKSQAAYNNSHPDTINKSDIQADRRTISIVFLLTGKSDFTNLYPYCLYYFNCVIVLLVNLELKQKRH